MQDRRHFLKQASAFAVGFAGLHAFVGCKSLESNVGVGPVRSDPDGVFDLPEGFSYQIISRHGDPMDDGFRVPHRPDGMATFPGPDGTTLLVRNHEIDADAPREEGPFRPGGDASASQMPADDLRKRGFADGAARFAREEGLWYGEGAVYMACTNGGANQKGQVWRYVPSPHEGTDREADQPGTLELFVEPNDTTVLENADNLTVAPWGDVIACEDGSGTDTLVGITPDGRFYKLGRNAVSDSELAGAVFSPDGSTLFMNIQHEGLTLAITGPWPRGGRSA